MPRMSEQMLYDRHVQPADHWLVVGPHKISVDGSAGYLCTRVSAPGSVTLMAPHHPDAFLDPRERSGHDSEALLSELHSFLKENGINMEQFEKTMRSNHGTGNIWQYRELLRTIQNEDPKCLNVLPQLRPESILNTRMIAGSVHGILDRGAAYWIRRGWKERPGGIWTPTTDAEGRRRAATIARQYHRLLKPGGQVIMLFDNAGAEEISEFKGHFRSRNMKTRVVRITPTAAFRIGRKTFGTQYYYGHALIAEKPIPVKKAEKK